MGENWGPYSNTIYCDGNFKQNLLPWTKAIHWKGSTAIFYINIVKAVLKINKINWLIKTPKRCESFLYIHEAIFMKFANIYGQVL